MVATVKVFSAAGLLREVRATKGADYYGPMAKLRAVSRGFDTEGNRVLVTEI